MSSSDATNLALGILGVLTVIPAIASLIKNRLPYARLRYFDELVAETDGFLFSLEEQGIFRKSSTVTHFRARLAMVRREAERPRMETYCAASIWQQVRGLFNGLSKKLSELSSSALSLRAEISTTASEDLALVADEKLSSSPHSTDTWHDSLRSLVPERVGLPAQPAILGESSSETFRCASSFGVPLGTSHILSEHPVTRPSASPYIPHLGDIPVVPQNARKRYQSEQGLRRNKRYLAARILSVPCVAAMEHRKSGVMHTDNFKHALRTRTYDSMLSGSTCVSESDSLPVHVKAARDHRHSGLRRVLGSFRQTSRDEGSDTHSSYRVARWISGLVPAALTID